MIAINLRFERLLDDSDKSESNFFREVILRVNSCSSNYRGVVGTSRHLFTWLRETRCSLRIRAAERYSVGCMEELPRVDLIECGDDSPPLSRHTKS